MNKNELFEIIKKENLSPNKSLGQNFLLNNFALEKIISVLNLQKEDSVLEIGPGLGFLTEKIIPNCEKLTAVEIDSGLYKYLIKRFKDFDNIKFIHSDFLKLDIYEKFDVVVSNLPYYCASEIIFKIAKDFSSSNLFVLLQSEMADRMVSKKDSKVYGALTVTLGLYYDIKILFKIGGSDFYPQPDVSSSFVHLKPKKNPFHDKDEIDLFHLIVKSAFWGRRKTILKSLSASPHLTYPKENILDVLQKTKIDRTVRAENLDIQDYINITKHLYKIKLGGYNE